MRHPKFTTRAANLAAMLLIAAAGGVVTGCDNPDLLLLGIPDQARPWVADQGSPMYALPFTILDTFTATGPKFACDTRTGQVRRTGGEVSRTARLQRVDVSTPIYQVVGNKVTRYPTLAAARAALVPTAQEMVQREVAFVEMTCHQVGGGHHHH